MAVDPIQYALALFAEENPTVPIVLVRYWFVAPKFTASRYPADENDSDARSTENPARLQQTQKSATEINFTRFILPALI
ncbi:MAG: hypothetical protein WC959_08185 [Kiritimatiellales bacterium]